MDLPHKNKSETNNQNHINSVYKSNKVPIILSIIALCISIISVLFSGYLYITQPQQINNYIQSHKDELKGDKGDTGARGAQGTSGRNGTNSYSPTYCSTYSSSYSSYSSTNCY